jgi:hypothetical protein
VTKDRDMEWRLVANKGRESCRWQSADGSVWIALTLGAQGDITKVVVAASDGRSEVVEGYEQGLNLARRWRNEWRATETPRSSTSGPWLPPLPGKHADPYGDDATPPSYPPDSLNQRPTLPAPDGGRSSYPPPVPVNKAARSAGSTTDTSPLPAKSGEYGSRNSQSIPPRPPTGSSPTANSPTSTSSDERQQAEGRDRSWPPRTNSPVTVRPPRPTTDSDSDGDAKPPTGRSR